MQVSHKIILASQCQVHDKKVHSVFAGLIERQRHQYGSVTKYDRQEQYPQYCELDSLQIIIGNHN